MVPSSSWVPRRFASHICRSRLAAPADEHDTASVSTPDLAIPEPEPYRLSRVHFSFIAQGGEVLVRDLHSALGTIVNDQPLGRDFPVDSAPLHKGENILVAGGKGSPFTFKVTLL